MSKVARHLSTGRKTAEETAKERLRLILTLDRASLSPHLVQMLKNDIKEVVSRYLVINEEYLEVGLENLRNQVALVITIPIVTVRRDSFSA